LCGINASVSRKSQKAYSAAPNNQESCAPVLSYHTSVSVPYHIGNGWGGGLVPFITTAAYQATGSLAYALIYPIAVPAICFLLSLFLMPETKENKIWESGPATA
jgi:hypothetical protein